ncbi:hypothetical protein KLP42_22520 [Rhizobium sp. CSW-27]|nr:hypothetical protein [Rhizobium sp. CSW-27]
MELSEARHIIDNLGFRRVAPSVIFFGGADNEIDDVRETAAAAAALLHGVIYLGRNDQLPTVLIEEAVDHIPDLPVGYVIATADKHAY